MARSAWNWKNGLSERGDSQHERFSSHVRQFRRTIPNTSCVWNARIRQTNDGLSIQLLKIRRHVQWICFCDCRGALRVQRDRSFHQEWFRRVNAKIRTGPSEIALHSELLERAVQ